MEDNEDDETDFSGNCNRQLIKEYCLVLYN